MVCDKMVLDRWCVTKLCVKLLYVKDDKVVCEVIVCERWYVTKMGKRRREEEEEAGHLGYRIKIKNPTALFAVLLQGRRHAAALYDWCDLK